MSRKLLFAFLVITAINQSAYATYDFADTLADGNVLYYTIYPYGVAVVNPTMPNNAGYVGYTRPSGDLVIPDSVTYGDTTYRVVMIGNRAFYRCTDLTSVTIPGTVTKIVQYAFADCTGLLSATIASDTIEGSAFLRCTNLSSVTFGVSVSIIGDGAFNSTNLTSVTIPRSVKSIGSLAFGGCSNLTSVNFNADSCYYAPNAFMGYYKLTNITFGDNVKVIPARLCINQRGLTYVKLPKSATSIGNYAFSGCTGLRAVKIPDSVTVVGFDAFSGCTSLATVFFGNSIDSIAYGAFSSCGNLQTIVIHSLTPPALGSTYAFQGRYGTAHLYTPCEAVAAYQADSLWGQFSNIGCGIVADIHPSAPLLGQTVGGGVFDTITDITLTAIPYVGNTFLGWSNGVQDNPYSLHLVGDTCLFAQFSTVDSIIIIEVHDTTFVPVHDTTIVTEYVHDTTYVPVHDTTIVTEYIHDTTTVTEYIEVHDTVWQTTTDTVWLTEFIHDTVYIHDTVFVGIDGVDALDAKIYSKCGQIVVEGAEQNVVTLFDVNGRILATRQELGEPLRFEVPTTGTYLVKIGRHAARKIVVAK